MNRHLLVAFISCMGLGVVFMNLPPVLPSLKQAYHVTNAQIAFLVTSLILAHALVQIPAGLITDRIGAKKTLLSSLAIILVSNLACTFNSMYEFVLAMRFLSGIGTGFAFNSGMKYAAIFTSKKRRGAIQGIFGGSFSIGGILPFFLMPVLAKIDWKLIYLATSLFFIFPISFLLIWGKETQPESRLKLSQFKPVFKSKAIWILGFLHAIFFGGVLTLGTWFSAFILFSAHGTSLNIAGVWGALMMLTSGLARFMGGFFLNRLTAHKVLLYSFLFLFVSYLMLAQAHNLYLLILFFYLAAYMSSVTFGPIFLLSSNISKLRLAATGFGIVNFIANLGSLTFPVLFGFFIDETGGYKVSFLFMNGLVVLGIALVFLLKKETVSGSFSNEDLTLWPLRKR